MEDDKRFSYFFLGLGIGVGLGVLFAPKSGEETRELLRDKADEGKEYLKRRSEELRESAADALDRSRQALLKQKEQIAAAVEAGKTAYREKVDAGLSASDETGDIIEGV